MQAESDSQSLSRTRSANARRPAVALETEVLAQIFETACFDTFSPFELAAPTTSLRKTRDSIASTCFRWREVALSASSLWSHIAIDQESNAHHHDEADHPARYDLICTEYQRAKTRPLALYVASRSALQWRSIKARVPTSLSRSSVLSFSIYDDSPFPASFLSNTVPLPILRTLLLEWNQIKPDSSEILELSHAMALRNLWIVSPGSRGSGALRISLSHMTDLTRLTIRFKRVDPQSVMEIINRSPNLESLDWLYYPRAVDGLSFEGLPAPIALCQLRYLSIGAQPVITALKELEAPSLYSLQLLTQVSERSVSNAGISDPFYSIAPFPNLGQLHIPQYSVKTTEIIEYIKIHPKLESAVLGQALDADTIDFLATAHETNPYLKEVWIACPKLPYGSGLSPDELRQLFERRAALSLLPISERPNHIHLHLTNIHPYMYSGWGPEYAYLWEGTEMTSFDCAEERSDPWDWRLAVSDAFLFLSN